MIKTAIIYGLAELCIDLITKPIIADLGVIPNGLIGQRFDSVMATLDDNELPPFVRPQNIPLVADWGIGNIRLNDARVMSYETGVYRFRIYDSISYSLKFKYLDLFLEYRRLYKEIGIYHASNDFHKMIHIQMDGKGGWIELKKSDIVLPSSLID